MDKKTFKDAEGVEFELTKDDFTFVQKDERIHDTKFETKATTFARDAFKRFCKNKSSVAASIIIGLIVVLSIFVPVFSDKNTSQTIPQQSYLSPKLFNTGTGFWDGTKKFSNITYDGITGAPAGFKANAVVKITNQQDTYIDRPSEYGYGGYLKVTSERGTSTKYILNYAPFELNKDDNYELKISFGSTDGIEGGKIGKYQVFLSSSTSMTGKRYPLTELTSSYEDLSINLSEYMTENKISDLNKAYIHIDVPASPDTENYILIKSIEITCSSFDEETLSLLEQISFVDANAQCLIAKGTDGKFPNSYWRSTARKSVYQAKISTVSFVYDYYEAQLGLQEDFEIGKSILDEYIAKGYCEYDYSVGPS